MALGHNSRHKVSTSLKISPCRKIHPRGWVSKKTSVRKKFPKSHSAENKPDFYLYA